MSGVRDLAASAAAALATGALVLGFWPALGLPERGVPLDPLQHAYVDRVLLERVAQ